MSDPKDRWLDQEAGPIVRPYALTRGRTVPASGAYVGLIDMVVAEAGARLPAEARLNPEHRRILSRCGDPITVVDLAAEADLPVGVVRVLLSDLTHWGAITVLSAPRGRVTNERLLRDVLHGLQAL
jgi:Protein of unknown function (DUF742)